MCVFVSYRYNAKVNFTEGRCPGSRAMVFDNWMASVTVPNVNIRDCDYTIAFWIRLLDPHAGADIFGLSKSGNRLTLPTDVMFAFFCREVSTATLTWIYLTCVESFSGVVMNNWTHVAVTCEQDNRVQIFFNGEIASITQWLNFSYPKKEFFTLRTQHLNEMFVIDYYHSTVIMDLHILGFALPRDEIDDLYRG